MIDRRRVAGLLAANAVVGGCAITRPPPVMINLGGRPPGDPADAALSGSADLAARMTVPVRIDDAGPFTFVVDTGANHSVIAAELTGPLGLPSGGSAPIHGIAGVEAAETVRVGRLSVGEVVSRRLRLPVLPRARLGADGLLGVDVLRDRDVLMDFRRNQLRIRSSKDLQVLHGTGSRLGGDVDAVVVPARYRFGQLIIIDADVAGVAVTAFLDSGSQNTVGNLALRQAVLGKSPDLSARGAVVRLMSATGQTASGALMPLPALRLGGLRIGNLSAVFADLHIFDVWDLRETPAILIGVDIMRHFESIELDFGRRRVIFRTPPRGPLATPDP